MSEKCCFIRNELENEADVIVYFTNGEQIFLQKGVSVKYYGDELLIIDDGQKYLISEEAISHIWSGYDE